MANGHGGKRQGAGRKRGIPNMRRRAKIVQDLVERGEDPLNYFLSIMKDQNESKERRDWAAAQAAPYCHPRLSAIDQSTTFKGSPLTDLLEFIDGRTASLGDAEGPDGEPPLAPEQSLSSH